MQPANLTQTKKILYSIVPFIVIVVTIIGGVINISGLISEMANPPSVQYINLPSSIAVIPIVFSLAFTLFISWFNYCLIRWLFTYKPLPKSLWMPYALVVALLIVSTLVTLLGPVLAYYGSKSGNYDPVYRELSARYSSTSQIIWTYVLQLLMALPTLYPYWFRHKFPAISINEGATSGTGQVMSSVSSGTEADSSTEKLPPSNTPF